MSGKARFEITQPISIVGFFVASLLLIALVSVASTRKFLGDPSLHALTQAFYYAIWSAAIYLIIAVLMSFTVWGAVKGKYAKRFNLTTSQRTLMLQTISLMVYLLIGALIFGSIEGWQYLDAVFWAISVLLTIGLGTPLVPTKHTTRGLLFPYTIGAVITVGLIVGSIRSMLLETGKQKIQARAMEKQRQRIRTWRDALDHQSGPLPDSKEHADVNDLSEKQRRRLEFHGMRRLQNRSMRKTKWTSLATSTVAASILWFIGALVFWKTEYKQGWTYFQSLYFSFVVLTTLGYGDFQPYSNSGKSFFVLWALLAVPTLTVLISDMGDTVIKGIANFTNYVGTLTILPGGEGLSGAWKEGINKFTGRTWIRPPRDSRWVPGAILAPSRKYDREQANRSGNPTRMLRSRLGDDDLAACQTDLDVPVMSETDPRRFYRWILSKEVGNVLADAKQDAAKKYTYDEWTYFLLLFGHKEDDADLHPKPNPLQPQGAQDVPRLGQITDSEGKPHPWSWLGLRSPLMSSKKEPDYILEHLLAQLQRELSFIQGLKSASCENPPIHHSMLQSIDIDGTNDKASGKKSN